MCLIIFAIDTHPEFPLIVAANRDEFYARETLPMHRWDQPEGMIAGKDVSGGGTWLGISEKQGIAMLTNFRDPHNINPHAPSRGQLVSGYFDTSRGAPEYLHTVSEEGDRYNGFNLICGNRNGYFYYGNYGSGVHALPSGVHGLSNALINDPWPKVIRGKERLTGLIAEGTKDPAPYLDMMLDVEVADDASLPKTGVDKDLERKLSPMFITSPDYGSRSTTVVMVDGNGDVTVVERTFQQGVPADKEREFRLKW